MPPREDFKGKTILFVRTSGDTRKPCYERVKELGATILCIHPEVNWAAPLVDDWIFCDTEDLEKSMAAVEAYLTAHPHVHLDGVATFDDYGVVLAAKLCDTYGLVGHTLEAVSETRCKHAFREFCAKHGILTPWHALVSCQEELESLDVSNVSFPLVIKPSQGAGSQCVHLAYSKEEVHSKVRTLLQVVPKTRDFCHWSAASAVFVLIEEYLDGPEVDIDMLVQGGEVKFSCVSDNFPTKDEYFLERGGLCPSQLSKSIQKELLELADTFIRKRGSSLNGCLHFEAKYTSRGAAPIEVNLRIGGAEVYTFVKNAWGVDLAEEAVRIALGQTITIAKPDAPLRQLLSTNFIPQQAGVLVEQIVDPALYTDPAFVGMTLFYPVGEVIKLPPAAFQYLGWMVGAGSDVNEATANFERLQSYVRHTIKPLADNQSDLADSNTAEVVTA